MLRSRHLALFLWALVSWQTPSAAGQVANDADSAGDAPAVVHEERRYPELSTTREIALSGLGAGLMAAGVLAQDHDRVVPSAGFDPGEIAWAWDRRAVDNDDSGAGIASDWTRNAAILFPLALGLATGGAGEGWHGMGRRGVVYAETFLVSQGLTHLGKTRFGRPRPYAYRPTEERAGGPAEGPVAAGTFQAMPSGHSSSAWTGAGIAVTEHLLNRPDAGWVERVGVGGLGGVLAGATSALRVRAGQHFPSDVLVGAGIGMVTGITVPLLHRGEQPLPSLRSWLQMMGGVLGGAVLGVGVAPAL